MHKFEPQWIVKQVRIIRKNAHIYSIGVLSAMKYFSVGLTICLKDFNLSWQLSSNRGLKTGKFKIAEWNEVW